MNVFDLFAKITLDTSEYEASLEDSKKKGSTFGDVLKATLTSQAIVTGVKTVANGIKSIGEAALGGYAEYEQLVGGVDTLFKESSDKVQEYAANAFKSAGMSANDYMSTVTSFSASLLASLGGDTEAAAEYADQAITDMADNANKMGTSIESIQNAYQGFAKQNYTMLDNLKLGYGGTKEEMQRLLDDASKISGIEFDISSFADVTQAIHIMQESMGIAGATAAEAEGTISGSAAAMKAAWTNLVTGMADENANVGELLDTFLESVETTGKNVIPVIKKILSSMLETIEERGPEMLAEGTVMLAKFAAGLIAGIPDMIAKIPEIVRAIVQEFKNRGPEFKAVGQDIVRGLWNGISAMASWIKDKVSGFLSGVVTGAKKVLGINSPSKVFAEMGGYMAEGLGAGWDSEYDGVKRQIESGLKFNAASIDFASSGVGRIGGNSSIGSENPIVITVQSILDGKILGESSYQYAKNRERMYGLA